MTLDGVAPSCSASLLQAKIGLRPSLLVSLHLLEPQYVKWYTIQSLTNLIFPSIAVLLTSGLLERGLKKGLVLVLHPTVKPGGLSTNPYLRSMPIQPVVPRSSVASTS
jgi:hypothetical protein